MSPPTLTQRADLSTDPDLEVRVLGALLVTAAAAAGATPPPSTAGIAQRLPHLRSTALAGRVLHDPSAVAAAALAAIAGAPGDVVAPLLDGDVTDEDVLGAVQACWEALAASI